MVDVPVSDDGDDESDVITDGVFEREFQLDREQAGAFLADLAERVNAGTELEVTGEDWRLPFEFAEPVELEIEFTGYDDRELEIELEFSAADSDPAPDVS